MRREEKFLELNLTLPEDFPAVLERTFQEEYLTACKKWKVSLSLEEREALREVAFTQLENKVSLVARRPWRREDPVLKVLISTQRKGLVKVFLPEEEGKYSVNLVRAHDEWKVYDEGTIEAVAIDNFYEFFTRQVLTWLRTAVFYAVGSYA